MKIINFYYKLKRCLLRLFRGLRYLFKDIKNRFQWDYESCEDCGTPFRIAYSVTDELWNKVYGDDSGCLCLNCFLLRAFKKGIYPKKTDITWLSMFDGDNGCVDIINQF
ncbi:MAG: hypothetical protein ACOCQD_04855 [archaeon]